MCVEFLTNHHVINTLYVIWHLGGTVPELWQCASQTTVLHWWPPATIQHDGVSGRAAVQPSSWRRKGVDRRWGEPTWASWHLDQNAHNMVKMLLWKKIDLTEQLNENVVSFTTVHCENELMHWPLVWIANFCWLVGHKDKELNWSVSKPVCTSHLCVL